MPNDGKLYVYPGTGTGQFDVGRRLEVILPASAPDPATFRQIVATEDITGDGLADMFALDTAGGFWFFNGWTGASFNSYKKLAANWAPRDIVGVRDISGDTIPDLLYRNDANASLGLVLRKGKAGTNGGVDTSLQAAASAEGGQDYAYGTTSWSRAERPMILGTPDTNGDGIPDVWATGTDANQFLFLGSRTAIGGASGRDEDGWNTFLTNRLTRGAANTDGHHGARNAARGRYGHRQPVRVAATQASGPPPSAHPSRPQTRPGRRHLAVVSSTTPQLPTRQSPPLQRGTS
ncbi:VCBS repeat-containing protein [Streptomyces sp. A1547]|nr:VCBS repeat-containing protein [Streptomyces sp. A1547]